MADGFDPVGIGEIAEMIGESPQTAEYLMGLPGAPVPVPLRRMKVWRASEVRAYFAAMDDRGPDGRLLVPRLKDGETLIPRTEIKTGQRIAAGVVTGIEYSPSGKTVYFTCRGADGIEVKGKGWDAAGRTTVYTGKGIWHRSLT
jgi:hypothetical protein